MPSFRIIERTPASVDLDVAPFRPFQLLQSLAESGQVVMKFRVVLGMRHQNADPPFSLDLLRPCRKRPRRRRAADQRDELPASHSCPQGQNHARHRLTAVRVLERGKGDANCDQLFWAGKRLWAKRPGQNPESANRFRFAPDSKPTSRSQNCSRRQLFANAAIAASRVAVRRAVLMLPKGKRPRQRSAFG